MNLLNKHFTRASGLYGLFERNTVKSSENVKVIGGKQFSVALCCAVISSYYFESIWKPVIRNALITALYGFRRNLIKTSPFKRLQQQKYKIIDARQGRMNQISFCHIVENLPIITAIILKLLKVKKKSLFI